MPNPRQATRQIVAALALIALLLIAAPDDANAGKAGDAHVIAAIYGCEREDSCRLDYRGDALGRGVWIVRGPGVREKVYGCPAEDDCRIAYRERARGWAWLIIDRGRH